MTKKLCKSHKNRMIGGVCGGIAKYFNIDATIVRLIWVAAFFLKGAGLFVYVIAYLVMPYDDSISNVEEDVDNLKSANIDAEKNETKSQKTKKNTAGGAPHSDEEFDSFFDK